MIHFWTDFCEKLLQFVICQFLICAASFFNWRKAQTFHLWETRHPQLIFFLNISSTHGSTISAWICIMSMPALLPYVQSIHGRDITTDSMSEWEKEWIQTFGLFEKFTKKNWQKQNLCNSHWNTAVLPKDKNGETWTIEFSIKKIYSTRDFVLSTTIGQISVRFFRIYSLKTNLNTFEI